MITDELQKRIETAERRLNPARQPPAPSRGIPLAVVDMGRGEELRIEMLSDRPEALPLVTFRVWRDGFPVRGAGHFFPMRKVPALVAALADVMDRLPAADGRADGIDRDDRRRTDQQHT